MKLRPPFAAYAALAWLILACAACGARSPAPGPVPGPSAGASVQRSYVLVPLVSMLRPGPVDAITIGSTILVRPGEPLTPSITAHELCHVAQYREHGWLGFPLKYLVAVLLPGNRFERECRRAEALDFTLTGR